MPPTAQDLPVIWMRNAIARFFRSSCNCFSFDRMPSFSLATCARRFLTMSSARLVSFLPSFEPSCSSIVSRMNDSDCSTSDVNEFSLLLEPVECDWPFLGVLASFMVVNMVGGRNGRIDANDKFGILDLVSERSCSSSSLLGSNGSAAFAGRLWAGSSLVLIENETGTKENAKWLVKLVLNLQKCSLITNSLIGFGSWFSIFFSSLRPLLPIDALVILSWRCANFTFATSAHTAPVTL